MKNNRNNKKEVIQPELGPRNWVTGKSLDNPGAIDFPGKNLRAYLQKFTHNDTRDKYNKNFFLKG